MSKIRRKRRCHLSVPADDYHKIEKAASSGVDFVFIDLEDSISPKAKVAARANIIKGYKELAWGKTTKCYRINGLDTEWCYEDIIEVVSQAGEEIDTLMIPKVKSVGDVVFVDTLLSQVEMKYRITKPIGLELLIEEVEGIENISEIAKASTRTEALHFGIGDYSRSMGIDARDGFGSPRFYEGDIWHYVRSRIVVAARANGLVAVDGPYPHLGNKEGFKKVAQKALSLGMKGKWAIHPSQIALANGVFTPNPKEVAQFRAMKAAIEKASAAGKGAIQFNGMMLDEAVIPMLEAVIEQSEFLNR